MVHLNLLFGKKNVISCKIKIGREKTLHQQKSYLPLVDIAWAKGYAIVETDRKAIQNRDWYPLSYKLLNYPNLIQMSDSEKIKKPNTEHNNQQEVSDDIVTVCIDNTRRTNSTLTNQPVQIRQTAQTILTTWLP
jgi:hypothetical protein